MQDLEFPFRERILELQRIHVLNNETPVQIRNFFTANGYEVTLSVFLDFSFEGKNRYLGMLHVCPRFIAFLNQFALSQREKREFEITGSHIWRTSYGVLLTAYRVYKQHPKRFREIMRGTRDIEIFLALAAMLD